MPISLDSDARSGSTEPADLPLSGYTVGVTADRRSGEQIQLLEQKGATCVHGPTLETQALLPDSGLASATKALIDTPPDVTILTTGIGVRGWFSSADALLLGNELRSSLESSLIYTRGPKAYGAAVTAGLELDSHQRWLTLDQTLAALIENGVEGKRVAIQLDGDPDAQAFLQLTELGADVIPVPVYQWTLPTNTTPAEQLVAAVADQKIDAITFTARPAVENFASIARDLDLYERVREILRSSTAVFCVGEHTAESVIDTGLGVARFPERPLLGTMVMLLAEHLEQLTTELTIGGQLVVLRGRQLLVGGEPAQTLTTRERQLFDILVSRPGVVFPKDDLLNWVWQGSTRDDHVVEVAIGRLRKRLGTAGSGIENVRKRGYRIAAA